ncbi:hypothetical protein PG994_005509 [Apiospora phragmitis]|uniref:N-acetyltransferase domain-containing protein n=1 Tax=Apiospora phragmitis TaxID=2905665 RepID=A0ABR1VCF4_9PEZI
MVGNDDVQSTLHAMPRHAGQHLAPRGYLGPRLRARRQHADESAGAEARRVRGGHGGGLAHVDRPAADPLRRPQSRRAPPGWRQRRHRRVDLLGVRGVEVTLPFESSDEEDHAKEMVLEDKEWTAARGGPNPEEAEVGPAQQDEQVVLEPEGAARIEQFEKMTSDHLAAFQKKIMPEGTRCMYIIAAAVDPASQGLGVGSQLVRWGRGAGGQKR